MTGFLVVGAVLYSLYRLVKWWRKREPSKVVVPAVPVVPATLEMMAMFQRMHDSVICSNLEVALLLERMGGAE